MNDTVFVHGNGGDKSHWKEMRSFFVSRLFSEQDLHFVEYSVNNRTHSSIAESISETIDRSVESDNSINVIAHSLGGTATRYWLKNYSMYDVVDTVITLGSPNNGMRTCPPRLLCKGLPSSSPLKPCQFFTKNSLFETPLESLDDEQDITDKICFYTIRGTKDELYPFDKDSPKMDCADKNLEYDVSHMELLTDEQVIKKVYNLCIGD